MILLPNPGKDPKLPNAYKPISILSALRKVWEKCLKLLIERCTNMDPFHRAQYGFRRKRSSVDAITQVMKIADSCKKKGQIYVLVTLGIKNAFSTLSWEGIRKEMIRRSLSAKIRRLVNNFLADRKVIVSNTFHTVENGVFAGVPQGSVLEPFLWNVLYDELLEKLDNNVTIKAIAFVDDLALTFAIKKNECADRRINEVMKRESKWGVTVGTSLVKDKAESIMITGRRIIKLRLG